MFTGLIEEIGEILTIEDTGGCRRIRLAAGEVLSDCALGSSVAVNGVCLTATAIDNESFTVELVPETLARTTFGNARIGQRVNLERPMRADSRFGGHIVQGHVDGIGRIRSFEPDGDERILEIQYEAANAGRMVWKGSIAIDGISLTIASLNGETLSIAIIPYTIEHTNLSERQPGDAVNIEFDVLAKYVEKLVAPYLERIEKAPE